MTSFSRPDLVETLFSQVCQIAGQSVWLVDLDAARIVRANRRARLLWQLADDEDLGTVDLEQSLPLALRGDDAARANEYDQLPVSSIAQWEFSGADDPVELPVTMRACRLQNGARGLLCVQRIRDASRAWDSDFKIDALTHSPVITTAYNQDGDLIYANPSAIENQRPEHTLMHQRFVDHAEFNVLRHEAASLGQCRKVLRVETRSGLRWHDVTARRYTDSMSGDPVFLISETDITDIKDAEQRSIFIANHDTLTGLPNRNMVRQCVPDMIIAAQARHETVSFLIMDLDRFKDVNDTLGHAAGDDLLVLIAEKLQTVIGDDALVARLGGDEFLICQPGLANRAQIDAFCARLFAEFAEPFTLRNHRFGITPSIGIAQYPRDGSDTGILLKCADLALYEAKAAGKNTYCRFSQSLRMRIEKRVSLEQELRDAILRNQLVVFYQPRVSTETRSIVGAEALVRWRHPEHGLLMPSEFIAISEETGLIVEIGHWLAMEVAGEQARLAAAGHDLFLSLNLSPRQFETDGLTETLTGLADVTGCDPSRIELEITESMLLGDDSKVVDRLNLFRSHGFGIAIDDFGTGYSNLSYIQRYPITSLKIDKSFIDGGQENNGIFGLIMSLCRMLDIKPVAEGIETEAQLAWLCQHRCQEYQGFVYSPPVPACEFWQMVEADSALPLSRSA